MQNEVDGSESETIRKKHTKIYSLENDIIRLCCSWKWELVKYNFICSFYDLFLVYVVLTQKRQWVRHVRHSLFEDLEGAAAERKVVVAKVALTGMYRMYLWPFPPGSPGVGTPLYGPYRYVRPQRVWFFSRFSLKKGIDFSWFWPFWS